MDTKTAIETLEYFESNLDQAASAFIAWVCFLLSPSEKITGSLHIEYTEALNAVPEFSQVCSRNAQVAWVILFHHVIEKRKDSLSLYKIDPALFKSLIEDKHKDSLEMIRNARHEVFAHKSKGTEARNLPSLQDTRALFKDIFDFFSTMNSRYNRPNLILETIFNNQFFVEDFEKIITLLLPSRNTDMEILKRSRIGNFLKL